MKGHSPDHGMLKFKKILPLTIGVTSYVLLLYIYIYIYKIMFSCNI